MTSRTGRSGRSRRPGGIDESCRNDAARFAALFPELFHRFRRRSPLGSYRPSAESLAVLRHLSRTGPLTVREAAIHFERSQAATSEILARLEKRGLLDRMADERDRRRTLVYLTATGLEVVASESQVLAPAALEAAFAGLKPEIRRGLIRGMEALAGAGSGTRNKGGGKR